MKKLLPLVVLIATLVFPLAGIAQSTIEYHYDSSGNRIERVIVLNTKSASIAGEENLSQVFEDNLDAGEIKIYPNPTEGLLNVRISKPGNLTEGTITVTDINGRTILIKQIEDGFTPVDLSDRSRGYYLMKITLGVETSTWKIIKK
jgi:hypothetical protein